MATSEIATLPGYEQFGPWLLVEKSGHVHAVSTNRPEAFNVVNEEVHHAFTTPELHETSHRIPRAL